MKKLGYFLSGSILCVALACQTKVEVYEKEVLIKEINLLHATQGNLDTSNVTETSKEISHEGSTVRILAQTIQNDSLKVIKKLAFYQSGVKNINIVDIQVSAPYNTGTSAHPVMMTIGSFMFDKSSSKGINKTGKSFQVDGNGVIKFDIDNAMKGL